MKRIAVAALLLPLTLLVSCGGFDDPGTPLPKPDKANFPWVADAMQVSCGTLDCHGQIGRNMRLYGGRGLRLDPKGNSADDPTTDAEYNATYLSIVALEPEKLALVLEQGGAEPERLTMIRKPRGLELHKGGVQTVRGDPLDTCMTSWLEGATDKAACELISDVIPPVGP